MKTNLSESKQQFSQIEETFLTMIDRITDAFLSIDKKGICTYANDAANKICNQLPGYLPGKNIWKEFSKSLSEIFQNSFEKSMLLQESLSFEYNDILSDKWYIFRIYPSGEGATVYILDISHRKKKEIGFNKLSKRNSLLLHIMQNSFLLTDTSLNVIDVNPAFCKNIGYTREELLKMNVKDFDVAYSPNEIKENLIKFEEENIVQIETKNKRKDGTIIDIEVVLTEVEIDGKTYFASFGHNISDRKKAEQQILDEKALSDSIINSLPGIFYLFDKSGHFLRWNKNFEIISKYTSDEIKQMNPLDFFDEDEKGLVKEKINEVYEKGSSEVEAHFFTRNKQKIPYYFNGTLATIEGKSCIIGTAIDITRLNKAQESVQAMAQTIFNQKVQEQKKITRAVIKAQEKERNRLAHELHDNVNQILAGTRIYLYLAGKKDEKLLELIKYPMELIDSSINEIRILTRKNATPLKNIPLKDLIERLLENLTNNCNIKTLFKYDIPENFTNDELKLNIYRIIQEEINNIIKHASPAKVTIKLKASENSIQLSTIDDGNGFDLGKKRKGIGLSGIINRVESFNGTIEIITSPGNGCQILIEIPYDFK